MTTNEPRTITYATAIKAIERAVNLRGGDYVYSKPTTGGCHNIHVIRDEDGNEITREMGCLIGTAFVLAGWVKLADCPTSGPWNDLVEHITSEARAEEGGERYAVTAKAQDLFARAQRAQDGGAPWGSALESAKLHVQTRVDDGQYENDESRRIEPSCGCCNDVDEYDTEDDDE